MLWYGFGDYISWIVYDILLALGPCSLFPGKTQFLISLVGKTYHILEHDIFCQQKLPIIRYWQEENSPINHNSNEETLDNTCGKSLSWKMQTNANLVKSRKRIYYGKEYDK